VLNVVCHIRRKIVGLNVGTILVWDILKTKVGSGERMGIYINLKHLFGGFGE
jgi:hypothetical protein